MKDLEIKTRALSSLISDISKGKFNFNHPLQRKSGQWNKGSMSLLIDSLVRLYPVFPILVENEENIYGVIDGKQRLTIIMSYFNNEFALSKKLEPVIIDGKEYIIAGKKFKKLDDAVKDRLLTRELQLYILSEATEMDIRQIFSRINSSKGLSNTQKRTTIENDSFRQLVFDLTTHPIFEKVLTPTQRKKDLDKDIIRQTLMLIETTKDNEFLSFANNDINNFITWYQENADTSKNETLKTALDKLNGSFDTLNINTTSLPMVFFACFKVVKEKRSFTKLVTEINTFIDTYETNEDYKKFSRQGTSNSINVKGRFEYWKNIIKSIK